MSHINDESWSYKWVILGWSSSIARNSQITRFKNLIQLGYVKLWLPSQQMGPSSLRINAQNKRTFFLTKRTQCFSNELGPSGESQITSSLTYGLNSVFYYLGPVIHGLTSQTWPGYDPWYDHDRSWPELTYDRSGILTNPRIWTFFWNYKSYHQKSGPEEESSLDVLWLGTSLLSDGIM